MSKIEYGAPTQDETFDELNVQEIVLGMLAKHVLDDSATVHVASEYERKGYVHRRPICEKTDRFSDDNFIISLEIVVNPKDFVKSELATELYAIAKLRETAHIQLVNAAREARERELEAELGVLKAELKALRK